MNPNRPLWQWSASEIVAATRSGAVSCVEVTRAVVDRMRAVNPRLNAVTLDLGDAALTAAAALDKQRASGVPPGPLFGVPVTIKDNVDVRGQRTPNGVKAFADLIAPDDSPVVKNLVHAGAIIIGRTNAPEFSMRATTNNALYGLTLNPWDARISCGGSSGGAGAAVAAGIGAIGHGNDIGGSIRFPALHCGIAGLKPTSGRVPAYLPSAAAERPFVSSLMSVQGPLARSVADLKLALGSMAMRDARDPWWVSAPLEDSPVELRVGLIENIPGLTVAPGVAQSLQNAQRALERAGYIVESISPPDIMQSGETAMRLLSTDMKQQIVPVALKHGSDAIKWYFDAWFAAAPAFDNLSEYISALSSRNTSLRQWMLLLERYPIVMLPQRMEPLLEVDEDLRSEQHVAQLMHSIAPSVTFNFIGLPSAMVPTGLHEELPTGVQLVASRYREDVCLAAAAAVEKTLGTLVEKLWARE